MTFREDMNNKNLVYDLPENLQNKILEMKKEIEQSELAKKFGEYIERRKEHNIKMDGMNYKYKNVVFNFGKYKGYSVYSVRNNCGEDGKQYLFWASKNVNIKDKVLKECVEFYKRYYYHHTDGYDLTN